MCRLIYKDLNSGRMCLENFFLEKGMYYYNLCKCIFVFIIK